MARTKPAEERRDDLMAAGAALFVAKGVGATTLEEITSGAGVSKGLFYQYFASKDDLIYALQDRFAQEFAERVRTAADRVSSWPEKLDACVEACFAGFQENDELHEALFRYGTQASAAPEPGASHDPLVATVRSILEEGVAADAFQVGNLEAVALLLVCAMHALDPTMRGEGDAAKDRQLVYATKHLLRRSVGIDAPPPVTKRLRVSRAG
jgi:TetR/AcrR family transcriptional regulator, transcriptional repressor for nem operon